MQGQTHEVGAVAMALAISPILLQDDFGRNMVTGGFLLTAAIGGLLPDADTPNSKLGRKLFPLAWPAYLLRSILVLIGKIIKPFGRLVKVLAHRGLSHTPFLWIILVIPSLIFIDSKYYIYLAGLYIGITSHLLLDLIAGGIPLLIPFTTKRKHFPLIKVKTGGAVEYAIMLSLLSYCILTIAKVISGSG